MKRCFFVIISLLSAIVARADKDVKFYMNNGEVKCVAMERVKCPNTVSSATVLLSSPDFTKTSHTLMYGVTSVTGATEELFGGVYSVGGTLTGGSSKSFTPQSR